MSERTWNRGLLLTAIAVAVVSSVSLWLTWQTSGDLLARLSVLLIAPVLAAALISYSLRILRFFFFLSTSGVPISLRDTLFVQAIGFALSLTPGHVGEVFKLHMVRERAGTPIAQTAPLLLLDRLTEGGGFMILALVSALWLPESIADTPVPALVVAGLVVLFLLALMRNRCSRYIGAAESRLDRFQWGRRISPHLEHLRRGLDASFSPKQILGGLLMSTVARFADGFIVLFAARIVGMRLTLPAAVFVLAVSGLTGGVSFLPAGTGAVETTMVGLLLVLGAALPNALAIALLTRLATLWLWVAFGLVLAFLLRGLPRHALFAGGQDS